jgi:desulfoferrodoxin (superoxide reductase-like protein)
MAKRLSRRDITRAIPVLMMGTALGGMSRFLAACTSESGSSLKNNNNTGPTRNNVPPTDDDEFVEGESTPVDTGEQPPQVPNQVWEARARQLEDDQARIYGNVFTNNSATNGVMAGKERSHVPSAEIKTEGTLKRATILVSHVMGTNGLDAGPYDAAADVRPDVVEAGADAGDAGDAAADAAPAVDAGKPPVHYITTIYIRADVGGKDTVVGLWEFQSTDAAPPSVKFTLPPGVTSVTAYEWCTLHGLWKSDPIPVT